MRLSFFRKHCAETEEKVVEDGKCPVSKRPFDFVGTFCQSKHAGAPPLKLENRFFTHFFGDEVCRQQEYHADNRREQPDGGGEGEPAAQQANTVGVCFKYLGHGKVLRVLQRIDLFKAVGHDAAHAQDQHQDNSGLYVGQRNMDQALPAVCTVNCGGFILFHVNACNGRKVDDGAPACFFPDGGDYRGGAEIFGVAQEKDGVKSQLLDDLVHHTPRGGKEVYQNAANHRPRKKMGKINGGLRYFFEPFPANLVQKQSQNDGNGKLEYQPEETEAEGVPEYAVKIVETEHIFKIFQPDPFAAQNAFFKIEVLKGDDNAVHGKIMKNQKIQNGGQQKQI